MHLLGGHGYSDDQPLAEDAAHVCALVNGVPARIVGDCAALAAFNYDRANYDRALYDVGSPKPA
jgi:hypothetical protein